MTDREHDCELRIRPERIGTRYTVEWATVEYNWKQLDWEPRQRSSPASGILERVRTVLRKVLYCSTSFFGERMPSFDVDRERINAFEVDGTYLFKHYFDQDDVFTELRRYYNESEYRFEVPADALTEVQAFLEDCFVELAVVDDVEPFCVVKRKYTDHPDILFKASILERPQQDYNVFLMKDQLSVEQAVNNGARRITETDIDAIGL
jgi:hypothetical protein